MTTTMATDGDGDGDDVAAGDDGGDKKFFHHPLYLNKGSLKHFLRTTLLPKHFLIISFLVYLHSITFPITYFH
jgi:hypothetical protein